ncbi:ABC transporter ATP-binding protein uup [compost metagenome]
MVSDYAGTVVVVSHDRDFLDRVATSVIMAEGDGRWTEYAGGYSDMVAQRGAGVAARVVEKARADKPKAESKPVTSAPAAKRKLSFKEKHALETLPKEIDTLDAEIATLNAALAAPDLYGRDPNGFAAKSKALEAALARKAAAEEQWLELEMLREELEG